MSKHLLNIYLELRFALQIQNKIRFCTSHYIIALVTSQEYFYISALWRDISQTHTYRHPLKSCLSLFSAYSQFPQALLRWNFWSFSEPWKKTAHIASHTPMSFLSFSPLPTTGSVFISVWYFVRFFSFWLPVYLPRSGKKEENRVGIRVFLSLPPWTEYQLW